MNEAAENSIDGVSAVHPAQSSDFNYYKDYYLYFPNLETQFGTRNLENPL